MMLAWGSGIFGDCWGDVDRNDMFAALINWEDHSALLVSRQRERSVRYWQHELRASLLLLPHHGA